MGTSSHERHPPPAIEGGWGWIALVAAFLSHILVSGYFLSLSVFVVEWQLYFNTNAQAAGFVGVIMGFMGPVSGLPAGGLSKTFGCRLVVIIGGVLLSLSMLLASFATELYHLYLTTFLTGLGTGLHYQPSVMVISFYFQEHLGLANGIAMSGVGMGMLLMPPFLQFLIDTFTWQKTYLILAALNMSIILVGIIFRPSSRELYFLKVRTKHKPLPTEDGGAQKTRRKSVTDASYSSLWHVIKFLGLQLIWQEPLVNLIFFSYSLLGFGFYSAMVFFTSKAVFDVGIEPDTAAWLISIVGIGSFLARSTHGFLIDRGIISPTILYALAIATTGIGSLLNPFMGSFAGLAVCAVCLGVGSGAGIALTVVCLRQCLHATHVSNAWGICLMFFGVGNLVGVYLMAFLYDATGTFDVSYFVSAGALFISTMSVFLLYCLESRKAKRNQDRMQEQNGGLQDIDSKEMTTGAVWKLQKEPSQESQESEREPADEKMQLAIAT